MLCQSLPSACFHRFLRYYGLVGLPMMRLLILLVPLLDFTYWFPRHHRTSSVPLTYLSSDSPSSQTPEECYKSHQNDLQHTVCYRYKCIDLSNYIIISGLNHFIFISALLLPALRLNLMLPFRLQGTGYRLLVRFYLVGFPYNILTAYKWTWNFFRPQVETLSFRSLFHSSHYILLYHNIEKDQRNLQH